MSTQLEIEDNYLQDFNDLIINVYRREDLISPITRITNDIYIGQGRTTLYAGLLAQLGITHILSIGRTPHGPVKNAKFEKLEITDIPDQSNADIVRHFQTCFDFYSKVVEKKGKVYVHCEMGCSRSATIAIAIIRSSKQKDTLQASYDLVKSKRQWIALNNGFQEQIKNFFKETLVCS